MQRHAPGKAFFGVPLMTRGQVFPSTYHGWEVDVDGRRINQVCCKLSLLLGHRRRHMILARRRREHPRSQPSLPPKKAGELGSCHLEQRFSPARTRPLSTLPPLFLAPRFSPRASNYSGPLSLSIRRLPALWPRQSRARRGPPHAIGTVPSPASVIPARLL